MPMAPMKLTGNPINKPIKSNPIVVALGKAKGECEWKNPVDPVFVIAALPKGKSDAAH